MIEELLDTIQTKTSNNEFRRWSEQHLAHRVHRLQLARLGLEYLGARAAGRGARLRIAATACWEFPIYSQTFVYQELTQLIRNGFAVRFLYSKLSAKEHLPAQFAPLWSAKRKLVLHPAACRSDYEHFVRRMPERVDRLVRIVSRTSGMAAKDLLEHRHFLQAFAFTRMAEACRPDYLHSYFFYEGTLFTFIASWLLDIPRGLSCYADHMLHDYELKLVPLHLEQCAVVVATSSRIKRELMQIAPNVDPERIIVKPNAINAARFPFIEGRKSVDSEPFRLVCVCRLEPKKGIIHLIDAVKLLGDRGLRVELRIVGGADPNAASRDYSRAVMARVEELNLRETVQLLGRQPEAEIRRLLCEAHLFVAPFVEMESGDKDGIPTALLEAMATGLPVVATDAGSITEVIDPGRDGLVTAQRDPLGLADAIQTLISQPIRREQMGKEAALKIRRQFDIERCEPLFHARIHEVVDAHRRGANGVGAISHAGI